VQWKITGKVLRNLRQCSLTFANLARSIVQHGCGCLFYKKIEIQVLSQAFASFTICKGVGSISALGYEQKA